ncbi:MAG: HAD family hydrolase [Nitrospirota bacterium]
MKKAVIFDLYGTLINIRTDEDDNSVYETLSRYLAYQSVNISAEELRRAFIGGVRKYMGQSKEKYPEVDVYKIFFDVMNTYGKKRYSKGSVVDISMLFRSLTIRNFGVFEGLYDVLVSLSTKCRTAIVSDAQWVFAEPEMAMLGLDQFFKVKIFSSRLGFKKPDPRLFHAAADKLGIAPRDSVYIGDNPFKDLGGAKNAGMKFVLFKSEHGRYNGYEPDGVFHDYSELNRILSKLP